MSPYQLAAKTGIALQFAEEQYEELSDEEWKAFCEEAYMYAYSPDEA